MVWLYDSPERALGIVGYDDRELFDCYAYCIFPLEFKAGILSKLAVPSLNVEPLPPSFDRLGTDVVSRTAETTFACSPLSCNHVGERVSVNRHCLLSDLEIAFSLAEEFSRGGVEPGPYVIVEVWRKRLLTNALAPQL